MKLARARRPDELLDQQREDRAPLPEAVLHPSPAPDPAARSELVALLVRLRAKPRRPR